MKFCETCGEEIYTKDGENKCRVCEDAAEETGREAAKKKPRPEPTAGLARASCEIAGWSRSAGQWVVFFGNDPASQAEIPQPSGISRSSRL